jgi:hypothetical protein
MGKDLTMGLDMYLEKEIGNDYDQWYYWDLEETVSIIDSLDPEGDYYYYAS